MTRAVRFDRHGGPEVLRIENVDVPPPGLGEVQIRVQAIGLNRADALLRAGTYIEEARFPSGIGLEAAGIVAALGEGVADYRIGEAVSVVPPVSMVRWPVHAELINVPAWMAVRNPDSFTAVEAAATWMQFLTAYGALVDVAGLRPGEFVVITAASSSVGLAAIQIANRIGATPVAVTRSSSKKKALRDAGAAQVVVTEDENLVARLDEITHGQRVRVAFDPVGGPLLGPLCEAMSRGGILIEYGGLSPEPALFPLYAVLAKTLTLRGYLVHEITNDPKRLDEAKAYILEGISSGALRPVLSKTFPIEKIVDAHRYMEANEQIGKITVTF